MKKLIKITPPIFKLRRSGTFLLLVMFAIIMRLPVQQQAFADQGDSVWPVLQLDINGAVGPETSDYVRRNFDKALENGVKMVIIRIDTPGGLDNLMQLLYQEGININNAYGFVLESSKKAVFVVDVDQMQKTEKLLEQKGFKTLDVQSLSAM